MSDFARRKLAPKTRSWKLLLHIVYVARAPLHLSLPRGIISIHTERRHCTLPTNLTDISIGLPYHNHAVLGLNAISILTHLCKSMACSPAYRCALYHWYAISATTVSAECPVTQIQNLHVCIAVEVASENSASTLLQLARFLIFTPNDVSSVICIQYRSSFMVLKASGTTDKKQCHRKLQCSKKACGKS